MATEISKFVQNFPSFFYFLFTLFEIHTKINLSQFLDKMYQRLKEIFILEYQQLQLPMFLLATIFLFSRYQPIRRLRYTTISSIFSNTYSLCIPQIQSNLLYTKCLCAPLKNIRNKGCFLMFD